MSMQLFMMGCMAASSEFRFVLNRGESTTGNIHGYNIIGGDTYGSFDSDNLLGSTIQRMDTSSIRSNEFWFRINGEHTQNLFTSLECSLGTFLTADADNFISGGGYTQWDWGSIMLADSGSEIVLIKI